MAFVIEVLFGMFGLIYIIGMRMFGGIGKGIDSLSDAAFRLCEKVWLEISTDPEYEEQLKSEYRKRSGTKSTTFNWGEHYEIREKMAQRGLLTVHDAERLASLGECDDRRYWVFMDGDEASLRKTIEVIKSKGIVPGVFREIQRGEHPTLFYCELPSIKEMSEHKENLKKKGLL